MGALTRTHDMRERARVCGCCLHPNVWFASRGGVIPRTIRFRPQMIVGIFDRVMQDVVVMIIQFILGHVQVLTPHRSIRMQDMRDIDVAMELMNMHQMTLHFFHRPGAVTQLT